MKPNSIGVHKVMCRFYIRIQAGSQTDVPTTCYNYEDGLGFYQKSIF